MGSARFVESLLSFVITHFISFFTNCPISTPELNRIIKPRASQPGPEPVLHGAWAVHELLVTQACIWGRKVGTACWSGPYILQGEWVCFL